MVCCCLPKFNITINGGLVFSSLNSYFDSFNYFLHNGKLIFTVLKEPGFRIAYYEQPLRTGMPRFYCGNHVPLNQSQLDLCLSRFNTPFGFGNHPIYGVVINKNNYSGFPPVFADNSSSLEILENQSITHYVSNMIFFTGFYYDSVAYTCEIDIFLADIAFKKLFNFRDFIRGEDGKI